MTGAFTVIKIGGSLLEGGELRDFLRGLAAHAEWPCAIVPGGGVFADAVRSAQAMAGFDDSHAHRLALDAMGQMAETFAALAPRLAVVEVVEDFAAVARAGWIPVWKPASLKAGDPGIAENWSVTSDSLALWLARVLGARRALIVKSIDPPPAWTLRELAEKGIVDDAFPAFAAGFKGAIDVLGPRRWREITAARALTA